MAEQVTENCDTYYTSVNILGPSRVIAESHFFFQGPCERTDNDMKKVADLEAAKRVPLTISKFTPFGQTAGHFVRFEDGFGIGEGDENHGGPPPLSGVTIPAAANDAEFRAKLLNYAQAVDTALAPLAVDACTTCKAKYDCGKCPCLIENTFYIVYGLLNCCIFDFAGYEAQFKQIHRRRDFIFAARRYYVDQLNAVLQTQNIGIQMFHGGGGGGFFFHSYYYN